MTSIPEDIMEAAREAYRSSPIKVQGDIPSGVLINVIADALLAERMKERERCAALAYSKPDYWTGEIYHDGLYVPGSPYDRGRYDARRSILNNKGEER